MAFIWNMIGFDMILKVDMSLCKYTSVYSYLITTFSFVLFLIICVILYYLTNLIEKTESNELKNKINYSIYNFLGLFPFIFTDLYYGFNAHADLTPKNELKIGMRTYLIVSGFTTLFTWLFDTIYKFCDDIYYDNQYVNYFQTLIYCLSILWHILGGIIFWNDKFNNIYKYNNVYDYLMIALILKYIFIVRIIFWKNCK